MVMIATAWLLSVSTAALPPCPAAPSEDSSEAWAETIVLCLEMHPDQAVTLAKAALEKFPKDDGVRAAWVDAFAAAGQRAFAAAGADAHLATANAGPATALARARLHAAEGEWKSCVAVLGRARTSPWVERMREECQREGDEVDLNLSLLRAKEAAQVAALTEQREKALSEPSTRAQRVLWAGNGRIRSSQQRAFATRNLASGTSYEVTLTTSCARKDGKKQSLPPVLALLKFGEDATATVPIPLGKSSVRASLTPSSADPSLLIEVSLAPKGWSCWVGDPQIWGVPQL